MDNKKMRLEYIDLKDIPAPKNAAEYYLYRRRGEVLADQSPVAPCVRCGRYAEDPTRDVYGESIPDHLFDSDEDKQAVCFVCQAEDLEKAMEEGMLNLLEKKLGLAEKHRDALRAFIETIFTDPAKILRVQDLDSRVKSLENQIAFLWVFTAAAVVAVISLLLGLAFDAL